MSDQPFVLDITKGFGIRFGGRKNLNVLCPFHELDPVTRKPLSKSRSCSVSANGLFSCKSCGARGNVVEFYAKLKGITETEARIALTTDRPSEPTTERPQLPKRPLTMELVTKCHKALLKDRRWLQFLKNERGLTLDSIVKYQLGCDEHRITIPIFDSFGKPINIRRYLPGATNTPKMVTHALGDGTPSLYPLGDQWPLSKTIVFCEGELDCIIANQNGIHALTHTGGVRFWNEMWTNQLAQAFEHIYFMFDVHDKGNEVEPDNLGQRMAQERADAILAVGGSASVVELPLPDTYVGGDITDWFVKAKRSAKELRAVIDESNPGVEMPSRWLDPQEVDIKGDIKRALHREDKDNENVANIETVEVTLDQATRADLAGKRIKVRALVAGKASAPYLVPAEASILVHTKDDISTIQRKFSPWDPSTLALARCSTAEQKGIIKHLLNLSPKAGIKVGTMETANIEALMLVPAEPMTDQPHIMREAFMYGHGIKTNHVYEFTGYTMPDPITQSATHMFVEAEAAQSDLETFSLSPTQAKRLRKLFASEDAHEKMHEIADHMSQHATQIYGRPDLHMAVDLVYHSPLEFVFDGVYTRKGWLEALIIGDTRTGKGKVAEGLSRYYGLGEVVSGENLSLAGLIGGVYRTSDRWTLVWGRLPLNDRRIVIMDECSALTTQDIGRLSRIRSEGVAEITKIVSERANARVRLLWLANPRPSIIDHQPRTIASFNYGIESVCELVGAAEDIARFDFVLVVGQSEVSAEEINQHRGHTDAPTLPSEDCRNLVLWSWSRKAEDIVFEPGTTETIFKAAKTLGTRFTPRICLVQAEDMRFKLARLACATAARLFSTDDTCTKVIVTKEHVEFAFNFLHFIYSKPCCGYAQMSAADKERSTLRDADAVEKSIREYGGGAVMDLIDGLLEHRLITVSDICDYTGLDHLMARSLISDLVRLRAITKEHNGYVKKQAFKALLSHMKIAASPEAPTTQEDTDDESATAS